MNDLKHRELTLPILSVVLGLLCAAVRRWQLATAFEGEAELVKPFAPASMVLLALLILSAAALFLLTRQVRVCKQLRKDPAPALSARGSLPVMLVLVTAAFLSLIAAPLLVRSGLEARAAYEAAKTYYDGSIPPGSNGLLTLISAATALLACPGLLMAAKAAYRDLDRGRMGVLLPVLNCCVWLMDTYRSHAANPIQWSYAPMLLAIICGALFYLDWAGFHAMDAKPRRLLWLAGMTVVLSAAALAGNRRLGDAVLLTSQLLSAMALLWLLPHNLKHPPEPAQPSAPIQENPEVDPNE